MRIMTGRNNVYELQHEVLEEAWRGAGEGRRGGQIMQIAKDVRDEFDTEHDAAPCCLHGSVLSYLLSFWMLYI